MPFTAAAPREAVGYDASSIVRASIDRMVNEGFLREDVRSVGALIGESIAPAMSCLGSHRDSPAVGCAEGTKSRAGRQAMGLAVDAKEYLRLFANGRGVAAQSPLPPGIS